MRRGDFLGDIEILVFPNAHIVKVALRCGASGLVAGEEDPFRRFFVLGPFRTDDAGIGEGGWMGEEIASVQHATNQGPDVRDVGDDDGGSGLADVPVYPFLAVRFGQTVVFGEDRADNDEDAEGEDDAQDDLLHRRQVGFDEDGDRDEHHQQVGGDVAGEHEDEVVRVDGALQGRWWDGPVIVEGSTPEGEEENFNDDVAEDAECAHADD